MRSLSLSLLTVLMLAAVALPARAADNSALMQRVIRLENDVNQLNSRAYRGGDAGAAAAGGGGDFAAGFEVRLSQIEQQMQQLTGRVEQLQYQLQLQQQQSEKQLSDLLLRVDDLEKAGKGGGPAPAPAKASPKAGGDDVASATPEQTLNPPAGTASGDPEEAYNDAYALIRQGDYPGAQQGFASFVATWPSHPLAGNAQYWLGQSQYLQKDYKSAATSFAQAYQRFPKSQKAPESLKQLGFALSAQGRKPEACVTFTQLNTQFPQLPAALKQEVTREQTRLACQ